MIVRYTRLMFSAHAPCVALRDVWSTSWYGHAMEPRGTEGNLYPQSGVATMPTVLTVAEVADLLRVTTKTVYTLVKRGDLPAFRVGRAVRFRQEDLDSFIRSRSAQVEEGTP